jgi:small GTP-binding protein
LSDGSIINVHIRDTCGQERFDSINEKYYQQADGILLVFDIAEKSSFNKIKDYYVEKIKEKCKLGIPIILLGNKTDLEDKREVSQAEAIDLSITEEYIYKETSCVKNENVADAFETIIEMWNLSNKKNNQKSNKRTKSKEDLPKEMFGGSFCLSERSYSYKKKINEGESELIILNNISKKKRKKLGC